MRFRRFVAITALLCAAWGGALAQDAYPAKPIRMIVPFPPGGTTDIVGRLAAAKLSERLGQQVVVENRAGAGGIIGHDVVAKAAPDGYTLMTVSPTLAANNALYAKVPHGPKDFTALAIGAVNPLVLVVHPSLPIKTPKELIAYAKANPGKLSWGAGSPGTMQHLSGEQLKHAAGIDVLYIPYKGTGALLPDLKAGRLNFAFESVPTMSQFIKSDSLRGIAVTGATRSPTLPDVPTMVESGLPDFVVTNWFMIFGPAGMPTALVTRLNRELVAAMNDADTRERLSAQGAQPNGANAEEAAKFFREETERLSTLIRRIGLKMD